MRDASGSSLVRPSPPKAAPHSARLFGGSFLLSRLRRNGWRSVRFCRRRDNGSGRFSQGPLRGFVRGESDYDGFLFNLRLLHRRGAGRRHNRPCNLLGALYFLQTGEPRLIVLAVRNRLVALERAACRKILPKERRIIIVPSPLAHLLGQAVPRGIGGAKLHAKGASQTR